MPALYPIDGEADETNWFNNSFDHMLQDMFDQKISPFGTFDEEYQYKYNVKIIYNDFETIRMQIEFPTEEDAVLFMFKWS